MIDSGFDPILLQMPHGLACHQPQLTAGDTSQYYVFSQVNSAFLSMVGLKEEAVLGKTIEEVFSRFNAPSFHWSGLFEKLKAEGDHLTLQGFFNHSPSLYGITVYRVEEIYVTLFHEISVQKTLPEKGHSLDVEAGEAVAASLQQGSGDPDPTLKKDTALLDLGQLIHGQEIHSLMHHFYHLFRIHVSLVDVQGELCIHSGWPDLCSWFHHREQLQTRQQCIGNSTIFPRGVETESYTCYRCKNNLWNMVAPLVIAGEHWGDFILGPFFLEERGDHSHIYQAETKTVPLHGEGYLTALKEIPCFSRERVEQLMAFYSHSLQSILLKEYSIFQLHAVLHRQKGEYGTQEALKEKEAIYRLIFENAPFGLFHFDNRGVITASNDYFLQINGSSKEALLGLEILKFPDMQVVEAVRGTLKGQLTSYEGDYHSATGSKVTPVQASFVPLLSESGREVKGGMGIVEDITVWREAQERLLANRREYKNLVENIEEGIGTIDGEGAILFANPAAGRIFGLPPADLIGRSLGEFIEEAQFLQLQRGTERRLMGDTERYDFIITRPHGERRIMNGTFSSREEEGKVTTFGVFRDITELQQTQKALQKSEEKFRTYTNRAPIGIFVVNRAGQYIEVNPEGLKMSGYTREDLFKKGAGHLVAPEHKRRGLRLLRRVMNEGFSTRDIKMARKDHSTFWVRFTGVKIDENQYMALCRDIQEQKEAEMRLDQKIQEQDLLLDNIEVQVWYLMDAETYGVVNKAHAMFFGLKKDDLAHENLRHVLPREVAQGLIGENNQVFGEKKRMTTEETFVNCKGERRLLSITKTPSVDEQGQVQYVICSAVDITEQKEAERQIRYMSFHDSLTNLYNRAYLEEEMIRLDTKRQLPISMIMGDINGLKLVNDTYGHSIGDKLLLASAQIFKRSCRGEDIITRWGGDEFVILLPQTTEEEVQIICSRITEECNKMRVREIPVQIALGAATKEESTADIYAVLREAENRMYKQKLLEKRSSRGAITSALLKTLGEKSHETEEHAWRMQKMALKVGEKIALSPSEMDRLSLLLTLHDIGKIIIQEEILTKPGRLNQGEWEVIKDHPGTGYRIASSIEEFAHVANDILAHHERWDGTGYPQGLKAEEIPLLARIASIVDAYDVMTSYRPYKATMSQETAITELSRCKGTQFDPEMVDLFISILKR